MTNKYYLWFTALISVIYLVLSFLYASNQIITDDQWYLYLNALDAAKNGNYSIVGQILPGVGPTVGSAGNFLTSLPLMFSDSPWAPMTFIILLRLLSFIIFSIALRHFFSNKTLCCFAVLYLLSPWFLFETLLTQSSYVIFGVSVVFLSLVTLRAGRSPEKEEHLFRNPKLTTFTASTFLVLGLGYCLQLSYLSISLVIMILFLIARRTLKLSALGLITGLCIIALTVWAFLNAILSSDEIGTMFADAQSITDKSPINLLQTAGHGILGWLRLGSTCYSHQIIRYFDPAIITAKPIIELISYVFLGIVYTVGGITLLINIHATYTALKYKKEKIFSWQPVKDDHTFLCIISIFAFLAIVISVILLPLRFQVTNVSTYLLFALLPMLILIERHRQMPLHYFATILVLLISFSVFVNLAAATSSQRFSQRSTMEQQLLERFAEDESIDFSISSDEATDNGNENSDNTSSNTIVGTDIKN